MTPEQQKVLAIARARKRKAQAMQQPQVEQNEPTFMDGVGTYGRAALTKPMLGGSFADELLAAPATVGTTVYRALTGGDVDIAGDYASNLQNIQKKFNEDREIAPVATMVGDIAGDVRLGLKAGKLFAKAAPQTATKLQRVAYNNPLTATAATGGVSGGVYGFGAAEGGIEERAKNSMVAGATGLALGPVAAYGASKVAQKAGPLTQRVMKFIERKRGALSDDVAKQATDLSQKPSIKSLQKNEFGEMLPMTQGQRTQGPSRQAMEIAARKGSYGQDAQQIMFDTDAVQQSAIRRTMGDLGAESEDALTGAGKMAQQAYKSKKAQVSKAYDNSRNMQNVYINKQPIAEQFIPRVKQTLKDGGFDVSDLSERGQKLVGQLDAPAFKDKKITSVNLEKMEFWRKKISNNIADNTDALGNMNPEAVAMKRIMDDYDRFMAKLPEDALKSGDSEALGAIQKARKLRREQGVLFERDKAVKKIVQNQNLTDEELANMVLTGSGRSEKINSGSGRLIKNLKRAVGEDNAPKLQDGLKNGMLARMLRKATTTTTEGDTATRLIDPAKLRNEFDALVKNKTLMKELFSPEQIDTINAVHKDLIKIASEKPGVNNYSNTAYALMRFVNSIPGGKAVVGDALESRANKAATNDIKKGLGPVLDEMIDRMSTRTEYYGAMAGGAASPEIVDYANE
jgi:hypothetical protein